MSWRAGTDRLAAIAGKTLFFVGGAPRSGTTWLQQMLDAHPEIACRGEGLFLHHLAVPIEKIFAERGSVIAGKNRDLFSHTGGFPHFGKSDSEHVAATAILLALARYGGGRDCLAVGEKTPENVFFFPRLKAMFPQARFIGINRDPRDVLTSAWHFFAKSGGQDALSFVQSALPSMNTGARAMLDLVKAFPGSVRLVTYEALRADPAPVLADLFALLGVSTNADIIDAVIAATEFTAATGRKPGEVVEGVFHRTGLTGDWRQSLPAEAAAAVIDAMGWSFAEFGWAI